MPVGIYFTGDYSTTMWIYAYVLPLNQIIYSISRGDQDSFSLSLAYSWFRATFGQTSAKQNYLLWTDGISKLWTHISVVLQENLFSFYVNAEMVNQIITPYPGINRVVRTTCYFGHPSAPLYAYLDDVMFFNKSLSISEIQATMN